MKDETDAKRMFFNYACNTLDVFRNSVNLTVWD
jgi:hypothetical protein